ncbi:MAG: hypothetical protein LBG99_01550 [Propionibacteriaceae bacterium]|nr:hypothetical protein [Propionibacteriaceae bacterium]
MSNLGLLAHMMIAVADRQRATEFWAPVLGFLGYGLLNENDHRICYASTEYGGRPRRGVV